MGKNDNNVRKALGIEAWDILIEKTKEGGIGSQHMKDISQALHRIVGGNHLRRVDEAKVMCDDHELREILGDWWEQELYGLNQTEALRKISAILSSREVNLPCIASSLRHCFDQNISDTILKCMTDMSEKEPLLSEGHIQRIKEILESIQESTGSKTLEEAYKLIEFNFKTVLEKFKSNNQIDHQIIEQVEDETLSSFQLETVKKFVSGDSSQQSTTETVDNRDKKMQDVKDSRLKLLILQILANLKNERRVRQVISEFNTQIASYEEWEKNIILRIKAKVDQEEKEAPRAEKDAAEEARKSAEEARIIAEETIEKLRTSVKEEEEAFLDQDQHTQSPRLTKPRRWVQQLLKKANPVNWPAPVFPRVGNTFPIYHS